MGGRNRCAALASAALLTGVLAAPAEATAGPTASAVPASAAPTATVIDPGTLGETDNMGTAPAGPPTAAAGTDLHDSALQACRTAQLAAHIQRLSPGAGQRYAALSLTNTSSRSCHLVGYPGLQLHTATGPAPTTVYRVPGPRPRQFTLRPGKTGWSRLHWTVVANDYGPEVTSVRITPPAETHFLTVPGLGRVCGHGRVDVTALSPAPPES